MKNNQKTIDHIFDLLKHCELNALQTVGNTVENMIEEVKKTASLSVPKSRHERRAESRLSTNLFGTLLRITDVQPHERKEYSVQIQNMSKNGLSLKVNGTFIPSQIVKITFGSPADKIREIYMTVVRMRRVCEDDGEWMEVGCRTVSDQEVQSACVREEKIVRMRNKVQRHKQITILVMGTESEETRHLIDRIKAENFQVKQIDEIGEAMNIASKESFHLVIFTQGHTLLSETRALELVKAGPADLAKIALISTSQNRAFLYESGFDECLDIKCNKRTLVHTIERAIVGHVARQGDPRREALVVSANSTIVNLITYQLEEHNCVCLITDQVEQIEQYLTPTLSLILVEFLPEEIDTFRYICNSFLHLPTIALCASMEITQSALANGARDYLCLPPKEEDLRMILDNCSAMC